MRDCLRTGSDSDVRDLLTRTESGLDIHVQVLRVRSDADSGTDMRAWIVLQQTVREKLVESSVELHPLSLACAEGAREQGVRTDETLAPHVEPRIEFAQCAYVGLSEKLAKVGVTEQEGGRGIGSFVVRTRRTPALLHGFAHVGR